jgi:Type II secretion system (T2SS), protein M subtype b
VTLQTRDKRALILLGVVAGAMIVYWAAGSSSSSSSSSAAKAAVPAESIDLARRRLGNVRRQVATLNGKEAVLKQASSELAAREKGLIAGETADEAQAQLLQILRRVAKDQMPPLDIRQVEFGRPQLFGDAYGTVSVSITMDCRIDEMINYLASISALPELVTTDEIRTGQSNPKQKTMPVRLTMLGVVERRLIPQKKGLPEL